MVNGAVREELNTKHAVTAAAGAIAKNGQPL
jgi:hypothetical protein